MAEPDIFLWGGQGDIMAHVGVAISRHLKRLQHCFIIIPTAAVVVLFVLLNYFSVTL